MGSVVGMLACLHPFNDQTALQFRNCSKNCEDQLSGSRGHVELCGQGRVAVSAEARPAFYTFFFLPGRVPARTFRAFSISRAVQSRTLTPPTFCNGGLLTVLAVTCLCSV